MAEVRQNSDHVQEIRDLGSLEEQLLVLKAQQGDQDSFPKLIHLYDRRLLYYICRLVGESGRAEDVSQEVWLTAHKKIISLRSPAAFRVWLFRIAHDHAVSAIRRDQRHNEAHEEFMRDSNTTEEWDERSLLEDAKLVHQALTQIPVIHREVLTLRFLEDLKLDQMLPRIQRT